MQEIFTDEEELVKAYGAMVYQIALTHVRNRHDADDIYQDVFVALFRSNCQFSSLEHQKAWIIKVTINQCKRFWIKSRQNSMTEYFDVASEDKEDYKFVYNAIWRLPLKYRVPLFMFYIEEFSIKEIAVALDISESAVKVQLHRARLMMKKEVTFDEI